jgi:hypothetical protein
MYLCFYMSLSKRTQYHPRDLTFIGACIMIYVYNKTNEMHQVFKFILFCSCTLHVSDGFFVHYQESKTVHTASDICYTDSAKCLVVGTRWTCNSISFPLASSQPNLFYIHLMLYVQSQTSEDGRKDRPKHVECNYKIK